MGGKFLLIIACVQAIEPQHISEFGAFSAYISIAIYIAGFDLYIGSARLFGEHTRFIHRLGIQFVLYIFITLGVLVVSSLVFNNLFSLVSFELLVLIILIDFISQELLRFLLSIGRFLKSSYVFFFKSGFWCYVSSFLLINSHIDSVQGILICWATSSAFSIMLALFFARDKVEFLKVKPRFKLKEISEIFGGQVLIFSSSLSFLMLTNMDKLFINTFPNKQLSAAYVFYASLTGAVITLIYTGLINPYFKSFSSMESNILAKVALLKGFAYKSIIFCLVSILGIFIIVEVLTKFLAKEYINEYSHLLLFFFLFVFLHTISLIPHFFLYIHKKDREIAISSVVTLVSTFLLMLVASYYKSHEGVILSLITGMLIMVFSKSLFCINVAKNERI